MDQHVLHDLLDLSQTQGERRFNSGEGVLLTLADVNALCPSICLQRGMVALQWFMATLHYQLQAGLEQLMPQAGTLCVDSQTNNFVDCKELEGGKTKHHCMLGCRDSTTGGHFQLHVLDLRIFLEKLPIKIRTSP